MRNIVPEFKSFSWKIIVRVLIIFLLNWVVLGLLFFIKTQHEFQRSLPQQHQVYSEALGGTLEDLSQRLNTLALTIRQTTTEPHLTSGLYPQNIIDQIDRGWAVVDTQFVTLQMELFNEQGEVLKSWAKLDRYRDSPMLKRELMDEVSQLEEGFDYIECYEVCYISVLSTLSIFSRKNGFIRISIAVDDVVDHFNSLYGVDIFAFRTVGGSLELEVGSRLHFPEVLGYFEDKRSEDDFSVFEQGEVVNIAHWFITSSPSLYFLVVEDITQVYQTLGSTYRQSLGVSLLIAFVMLGILYVLLKDTMQRLRNLSQGVQVIGMAKFKAAQSLLEKSLPETVGDEVDLIHQTAHKVATQLEMLHNDLKHTNRELQILANNDFMTGLPNRRCFEEKVKQFYTDQVPIALAIMDVDHFKIINDRLGHEYGDQLLIQCATILEVMSKPDGIAGRLGGDEFALLIPMTNYDTGSVVALLRNIALAVADITIEMHGEPHSSFSLSIGLAYYPSQAETPSELFSFADVAMYENKNTKLRDVNVYSGEEQLLKRRFVKKFWYDAVIDALLEKRFRAYFHPIVHSGSKEIFSYEVLARIEDYRGELLYLPDEFMAYSEDNRTIVEIDRQIISNAMEKVTDMESHPHLMINLSNSTLIDDGIEEFILEVIKYHHYDPCKITFEITEHVEIVNLDKIFDFIKVMSEQGFTFALDDFGAGYSSFFYLEKLNFDYLKVDKRIISDIGNEKNYKIFESIVTIAKSLRMKVVVEGVENKEVLSVINSCNVDFVQGYYFSKPLSRPISQQSLNEVIYET